MRSLSSQDTSVESHLFRKARLTSSQAAAYKLGADYPKELYENDFAKLAFRAYLGLTHGKLLKKSRTS